MQAKRVKIISVSPESRNKLAAKYGCANVTIYQALRYHTHSERAKSIRKDALEHFGGRVNSKIVFNEY